MVVSSTPERDDLNAEVILCHILRGLRRGGQASLAVEGSEEGTKVRPLTRVHERLNSTNHVIVSRRVASRHPHLFQALLGNGVSGQRCTQAARQGTVGLHFTASSSQIGLYFLAITTVFAVLYQTLTRIMQ